VDRFQIDTLFEHFPEGGQLTQPFHLARAIFLARSHDLDAIGLEVRAHRADRFKDGLRETLARSRAVADVLFGIEPRFYGEPVPISGSASATH
jgi:SanA protein